MRKWLFMIPLVFLLASCEDATDIDNPREPFLGLWTVTETEGELAPQTYGIEIYAIGLQNDVGITGLYNQGGGFVLQGEVSGRTLLIPLQNVGGLLIGGSGTIDSDFNQIEFNFTANDGSGNDQVKAIAQR